MTGSSNIAFQEKCMKKFTGKSLAGKVVSVHSGSNEDLSKEAQESLTAEIGGFTGDKHHGPTRKAFDVDWQPAGTGLGMKGAVARVFSTDAGVGMCFREVMRRSEGSMYLGGR